MEKRKVQEAVAEWQAEKRRRMEDGEEEVGGDADDEDVQDVQVRVCFGSMLSFLSLMIWPTRLKHLKDVVLPATCVLDLCVSW